MEIKKIKTKCGEIEGPREKEGYYLKVPTGYVEIFMRTSYVIDSFKEIISEKNVRFDTKGKMVIE